MIWSDYSAEIMKNFPVREKDLIEITSFLYDTGYLVRVISEVFFNDFRGLF